MIKHSWRVSQSRILLILVSLIPLGSATAQPRPAKKEVKVPFGDERHHPPRRFVASLSANAGVYSGIIQSIYSGYRWPEGTSTLTFSFHSDSSTPLSDETKDNYRRVFLDASRFIPIDFVETDAGDLRITRSIDPDYAYAYYPVGDGADDGDIYLKDSFDSVNPVEGETNSFQKSYGSHGLNALVHELGHALGLKHSFEPPACSEEDDNQSNTAMTYNFDDYEPATFMRYDVKTLQYLYGERPYNGSDDTYVFSDRLDTFIDSASQTFYDAPFSEFKNIIWDSGGIDTVDISAVDGQKPTWIDLREGGVISFFEDYIEASNRFISGTALAYGVGIETVIVSRADDTIYLNDANNVVRGYNKDSPNGDDIIWGASASDELNLDQFSQEEVEREQVGNDLVIWLPEAGTVTLKDYFVGSAPEVVFRASATPTPSPTAVATPSTRTPQPTATPTPRGARERIVVQLEQVSRVRHSIARFQIGTFTRADGGKPRRFRASRLTLSCTGRQGRVSQSVRTNRAALATVQLRGVSAGMFCRAEGILLGKNERSIQVKLR